MASVYSSTHTGAQIDELDGRVTTNTTNINNLPNSGSVPMLNCKITGNRPVSADIGITGSGCVKHFLSTSSMTTNKPLADGHILHFDWDNTGGYDAQLYLQNTTGQMQVRGMSGGTWQPWRTILDTTNFNTLERNNNYGQKKWGATTLNASTTSTSNQISITTHGRPVFLSVNGNLNPGAAEATWIKISLWRGGTELARTKSQSNSNSLNESWSLQYLDIVGAGTYNYIAKIERGAGTCGLSEDGAIEAPQFLVFEI